MNTLYDVRPGGNNLIFQTVDDQVNYNKESQQRFLLIFFFNYNERSSGK